MINFAFRILLTFNATSLLAIVYCVQKGHKIQDFLPTITFVAELPSAVSYFLYLMIPVSSTWLSIHASSFLGKDKFAQGDITSIQHANNSFLPSYLGYFFVALSINSWQTLAFVYSVLFVFTLLSQALYFNPLFLLFKFEFYNITTKNGASVFLISRNCYKSPGDMGEIRASRINNYTYIERDV